jgi:hypothetical protein
MKQKKIQKKLVLKKENVATLTEYRMDKVKGEGTSAIWTVNMTCNSCDPTRFGDICICN